MAETTLEKINEFATQEFLEKGFRGASLREIVKKAGVTTGAFYGYYKSKEELFSALVKPHADYVANLFVSLIEQFKKLPKSEWAANMARFSKQGYSPYAFDQTLEHIIISGEFAAIFELIVHDIPFEEGLKCAQNIHDFYEAGWQSVLKLK